MSICPFMSKSNKVDDWSGCITTCELRINNSCALKILAQKAIHDAKREKSNDVLKSEQSAANSTG
jgi:hypothetical protein